MNKLFLTALMAITLAPAFAQVIKMSQVGPREMEQAELRKARGVERITYKYYQDSLSYANDENFKIEFIEEFDENGDEVRVYSPTKNGVIYLSVEYEYDDQHRRISCQEFYADGSKAGQYIAVFSDSAIISERRLLNYMSLDSSIYLYNQDGNKVFEITYKDGILQDSVAYTDDENGRRLWSQSFTDGKLDYYTEYEYLTDKDFVQRIFERDSTLRLKIFWKYDQNGNMLDRVEFNSDEKLSTWYKYTYDCDGNEIASGVYKTPEERLSFRSESFYQDGKLQCALHFNKENELSYSSEYHYDQAGMNTLWIRRAHKNGENHISFIYKMEIDYRE